MDKWDIVIVVVGCVACALFGGMAGYNIADSSDEQLIKGFSIWGTVTNVESVGGENYVTLKELIGSVVIIPGNITPEIGKKYSFNYVRYADIYVNFGNDGLRVMTGVELEEIR